MASTNKHVLTRPVTPAEAKARRDYWKIWVKPYADENLAHRDPYQHQRHYDGE